MISRFEETRDLRLMGGFQQGADAELDQAVALIPIIYEAMIQSPRTPASTDAFRELAEALGKVR
jgi:flagellum-specific ATP synthase